MSVTTQYLEGSKNPFNMFGVLKHDRDFRRAHPEYFDPEGLLFLRGTGFR